MSFPYSARDFSPARRGLRSTESSHALVLSFHAQPRSNARASPRRVFAVYEAHIVRNISDLLNEISHLVPRYCRKYNNLAKWEIRSRTPL